MGSFADEAFGPEPGSLIQVQDPIPRPAPIVRPGEGGYAAPRAAAPVVEPPPAPPAGDNSVKDWVRLMQKHGVPHSQMPDLSEYYYDIDRKGAGPRPGMSPELDADIRAYQKQYPGLGKTAPKTEEAPKATERPAETAPKSYADEAFGPAPGSPPAASTPAPQGKPQAAGSETWGQWLGNTIRGRVDPAYKDLPSIRGALRQEHVNALMGENYNAKDPAYRALKSAEGGMSAGFALAPGDQARNDIVRQQLGDRFLGFEKDMHGAPVVVYRGPDGKPAKAYVNRPGLDMEDVIDTAVGVLPFGAAAKVAGAATRGMSMMPRMLAQGGAAGAASIGNDIAAMPTGSNDLDLGKAAITAGVGAASEPIAAGVGALVRRFKTVPGLVDDVGNLTPKGLEAAKAAGIDPATITPQFAKQFAEEFAKTGNAARAGMTANTQSFKIPVSKAQISKDPGELLQEKAMRTGVYGQKPKDIVQSFDRQQANAVEEAALGSSDFSVANSLNPNRQARGVRPDIIGSEMQSGVQEAQQAAKTNEGTIWDQVKRLEATDAAKAELPDAISSKLGPLRVDEKLTPKAHAMAEDLDAFIAGKAPGAGPQVLKQAPVQDLGDMRKRLLAIYRGAEDRTDKAAAKAIYDGFNEWIDTSAQNALLKGDPASAVWMRQARDVTKEMQAIFGPTATNGQSTPGRKIVQSLLDEGTTPETIVGKLFSTDPGAMPKAGTQEALSLIKQGLDKYLPPIRAKAVWDDIRLASWQKLVQKSDGELHTPLQMAQRIDRFFQSQNSVVRALYTKEEQALMRRFGAAMKDIAWKDPNPSGTATAGAFYASQFGKAVHALLGNPNGPFLRIAKTMLDYTGLPESAAAGVARSAVSPASRPITPNIAPAFTGPASQRDRAGMR